MTPAAKAATPRSRAKKPTSNGTASAPAEETVEQVVSADEELDQVLDLVSLAPTRRLVKIATEKQPEGEAFELRLLDDFGIAEQQQLLTWSQRFQDLMTKTNEEDPLEPLTDDEKLMLKVLLDKMFEKVLDAPTSVKEKMPDSIRGRVVTAFTLAPLLAQQEAELKALKEKEAKSGSTTES